MCNSFEKHKRNLGQTKRIIRKIWYHKFIYNLMWLSNYTDKLFALWIRQNASKVKINQGIKNL